MRKMGFSGSLLRSCGLALGLWLATGVAAHADLDDVECDPSAATPCRVKSTGLELRLLVKPQSNVYAVMDEKSAQIRPNVPAFEVYYAFAQSDVSYDDNFNSSGWFQVGANTSGPEGFMRAADVVPWKQTLAVAFTNPGPSERKPVLMFKSAEALDETVRKMEDGSVPADTVYSDVLASKVPEGIVSREPSGWVDIEKTFYLMPILSYEEIPSSAPDDDLKGLQLAALTNQARSQQTAACDITQANANDCLQAQTGGGSSSALGMDVVFVVDMTNSMQPYIDAVSNAVRDASRALSANFQASSKLHLGLVGYRDDPEVSQGLEFSTKNFTPDLLEPEAFAELLSSGVVKAADVGSGDYAEDVFAGLKTAIDLAWSPSVPRVIILIGDASGHPVGDPKNSTGLDERSIKELADKNSVYIASIYVGDQNESDYALARPQFETVAAGDGESSVAFSRVTGSGQEGSGSLESSLRDVIDKVVGVLSKGNFGKVMTDSTDASDTTGQAVMSAVRAAFVDYLGTDAKPPSNLVAWALDRDPTDYKKKAFDIKLMLRKKDLIQLKELLGGLTENLQAGAATGSSVFLSTQGGSTAASYDLGIAKADKLGTSKFVPTWIKNLPYKSEILTLSLDEFQNSSPDDRAKFEARLQSLTELYDDILNRPEAWVPLNENGNAEEQINMLDLSNLP